MKKKIKKECQLYQKWQFSKKVTVEFIWCMHVRTSYLLYTASHARSVTISPVAEKDSPPLGTSIPIVVWSPTALFILRISSHLYLKLRKQDWTKQNKTKQNKTKLNKTKHNKRNRVNSNFVIFYLICSIKVWPHQRHPLKFHPYLHIII